MKREVKLSLQANRLLGEYTGIIQALLTWKEMPADLRERLRVKLKELLETKIVSIIKCKTCKSKGIINNITCSDCNGEGYL